MRVGIFGGTFNPPHNGHLIAASAFMQVAALDRLLVIPTQIPPHKNVENISSVQRLQMTQLAFSDMPKVTVSDMEIQRGGVSYTADTLAQLSKENAELFLLCGTDMFLTLDTWYHPEIIFQLATVCCISRDFSDENQNAVSVKIREYKEKYCAEILTVENPHLLEISSTEIRNAVKNGEKVLDFLPQKVYDYILKEGLYS